MGYILDLERRNALCAPFINGQAASEMQRQLTLGEERFTEFGAHGTESDSLDSGAIGGGQGAADVVAAGRVRIDHLVGGAPPTWR